MRGTVLWVLVFQLALSGCVDQVAGEMDPERNYSWEEIRSAGFPGGGFPVYVGNYQDYWLDWSPEGDRLVGLAIDQDFGIHVLDLRGIKFRLNEQSIWVPYEKTDIELIPWTATVLTEPMQQGSPSWSNGGDLLAYVEFTPDFKQSKIVLFDLEEGASRELALDVAKIEGVDFGWADYILAAYGSRQLFIVDAETGTLIARWTAPADIQQVSWFPDDRSVAVIFESKAYRLDLASMKVGPDPFHVSANWSHISFVPGTNEFMVASGEGLLAVDFSTGETRRVTSGLDYQPHVSADGQWVAYISETPFGGFLARTSRIGQ